jgi:hypothetical protein
VPSGFGRGAQRPQLFTTPIPVLLQSSSAYQRAPHAVKSTAHFAKLVFAMREDCVQRVREGGDREAPLAMDVEGEGGGELRARGGRGQVVQERDGGGLGFFYKGSSMWPATDGSACEGELSRGPLHPDSALRARHSQLDGAFYSGHGRPPTRGCDTRPGSFVFALERVSYRPRGFVFALEQDVRRR